MDIFFQYSKEIASLLIFQSINGYYDCILALCDQIQEITSLKPNLTPDNWDVDLNMIGTRGLQFDPKSKGNTFVPVVTNIVLLPFLKTW